MALNARCQYGQPKMEIPHRPSQPSRHHGLRALAITFVFLFLADARPLRAEAILPLGPETAPVPAPHFPSPAHAVIWRNWTLVEPSRIAQTLGAEESAIRETAAAMGLPAEPAVAPEWKTRGYITMVRRNWHLLPYGQLLTLLGMEAEELAFALREDDFLFVKLGSRKPRCAPVHLGGRDDATRAAEEWIRATWQAQVPVFTAPEDDPPFSFVKKLSALPEDAGASPPSALPENWREAPPRFLYSYFAPFGDPLSDPTLDPYPDGLLARLAAQGVNGVWLHVVLRQLAPGGEDFPEFGEGWERRLATLRGLVRRAEKYGILVYLYLNEPRAMPEAFFASRPEMAGVAEGSFRALCTSDARVRRWLENATAHVFTHTPGLGGVFTISGSENQTHCASHGRSRECSRCFYRDANEITAEANAVIVAGAKKAAPSARVFVWDWGWHGHGEAPGIISRLPKDAWLMSVSEWAAPYERGGIKGAVGEYSLSVPGPGPRAVREWSFAREAGLKTMAKVQFNLTWELAAVPWLPVCDLVAEHCAALRRQQVDGLMLSWSLGGHPSPTLRLAKAYFDHTGSAPPETTDAALRAVATANYGEAAAPAVREAWRQFSAAFREYPYDGGVVYNGPQHMGPANLPLLTPSGQAASMVGLPLDDLPGWRGPYPPEIFARQWEKVATGWRRGLEAIDQAAPAADPAHKTALAEDTRFAHAAGIHFASAAAQTRYLIARQQWLDAAPESPEKNAARDAMAQALREHRGLAGKLHALARADSRIGFEASNHYFYRPQDLAESVLAASWILRELE